ncbi:MULTISPECIES: GNAT family N-acetyltransferase [unclassified Bacillus (in: firmicutes)]|uniref:GNAT family N-acetyltransferase n=1 Tax=unclassified Bacillus (in: firmicutes) TaxID=185979 RepID=UPI00232CE854|nr:GNAT family N-acetyltransferase [Bacillus sp. BP-3]MDC2864239.1 GNAT family N-acetyltransferase [Bacillus sp. BP-3]
MIRMLTEVDAEEYWDLRLEALQKNPEAYVTTYEEAIKKEEPIQEVIRNLQGEHSSTFGAFDENNKLIGVVTLLTESRAALRHKGHIVGMYVSAQSRGRGYARNLIDEVVKKAKGLTIEQISLSVVSDNIAAKKLYQSIGFESYGVEKKALKMGEVYRDEEFMVLFL